MNLEHVTALLRREGIITAEVDGLHMVSDGRFFTTLDQPWDGTVRLAGYAPLVDYWRKYRAPGELVNRDRLYKSGEKYLRRIGDEYIDEAFYRALCTPILSGFWIREKGSAIGVYEKLNLIGGIMPMRVDRMSEPVLMDHSPTDEIIFESFACEANGYYLQGDKVVLREIAELERERRRAQDDMDEAEEKRDEIDTELIEKRALAAKLRPAVTA